MLVIHNMIFWLFVQALCSVWQERKRLPLLSPHGGFRGRGETFHCWHREHPTGKLLVLRHPLTLCDLIIANPTGNEKERSNKCPLQENHLINTALIHHILCEVSSAWTVSNSEFEVSQGQRLTCSQVHRGLIKHAGFADHISVNSYAWLPRPVHEQEISTGMIQDPSVCPGPGQVIYVILPTTLGLHHFRPSHEFSSPCEEYSCCHLPPAHFCYCKHRE